MCRKLVAAGFDPTAPLEAWRGPTLCLRIRSIGEAAKLTVRSAGNGSPILAWEHGAEGAGPPPIRKKQSEEMSNSVPEGRARRFEAD
jgi:hypothetical protein